MIYPSLLRYSTPQEITLLLFAVVVVSASSDLPSLSAEKILIVMIGRMLEEVRLLLLEARQQLPLWSTCGH